MKDFDLLDSMNGISQSFIDELEQWETEDMRLSPDSARQAEPVKEVTVMKQSDHTNTQKKPKQDVSGKTLRRVTIGVFAGLAACAVVAVQFGLGKADSPDISSAGMSGEVEEITEPVTQTAETDGDPMPGILYMRYYGNDLPDGLFEVCRSTADSAQYVTHSGMQPELFESELSDMVGMGIEYTAENHTLVLISAPVAEDTASMDVKGLYIDQNGKLTAELSVYRNSDPSVKALSWTPADDENAQTAYFLIAIPEGSFVGEDADGNTVTAEYHLPEITETALSFCYYDSAYVFPANVPEGEELLELEKDPMVAAYQLTVSYTADIKKQLTTSIFETDIPAETHMTYFPGASLGQDSMCAIYTEAAQNGAPVQGDEIPVDLLKQLNVPSYEDYDVLILAAETEGQNMYLFGNITPFSGEEALLGANLYHLAVPESAAEDGVFLTAYYFPKGQLPEALSQITGMHLFRGNSDNDIFTLLSNTVTGFQVEEPSEVIEDADLVNDETNDNGEEAEPNETIEESEAKTEYPDREEPVEIKPAEEAGKVAVRLPWSLDNLDLMPDGAFSIVMYDRTLSDGTNIDCNWQHDPGGIYLLVDESTFAEGHELEVDIIMNGKVVYREMIQSSEEDGQYKWTSSRQWAYTETITNTQN